MSAAFPEDVVINVLIRLPVKTLLRLKSLSKQFRSLIEDPYFIKLHLECSIQTNSNLSIIVLLDPHKIFSVNLDSSLGKSFQFDYQFASAVGSSNGLVAFCHSNGQDLALLNPLTRRYRLLPRIYNYNPVLDYGSLLGFCYDAGSDDYKLVRIFPFERRNIIEAFLYSLKRNSWKQIEIHYPYGLRFRDRSDNNGVFVGSALHWVATENDIFGFDMRGENFFSVPQLGRRKMDFMTLNSLGGRLCCVYHYLIYVDVYVMMEYGVKESWAKLFAFEENISDDGNGAGYGKGNVLTYSRCGKKVLFDKNDGSLHWYDLEEETEESFEVHGETESISAPVICVESLISPG